MSSLSHRPFSGTALCQANRRCAVVRITSALDWYERTTAGCHGEAAPTNRLIFVVTLNTLMAPRRRGAPLSFVVPRGSRSCTASARNGTPPSSCAIRQFRRRPERSRPNRVRAKLVRAHHVRLVREQIRPGSRGRAAAHDAAPSRRAPAPRQSPETGRRPARRSRPALLPGALARRNRGLGSSGHGSNRLSRPS